MKKFLNHKKGFTIIELIVIMGVMAILVFLGSLGYKGYTKQARMTLLLNDAKVLSDACERYYVDHGDYPRTSDTPYTAAQVADFSAKIYDHKGQVITLDSAGSYYDIDYSKIQRYAKINEDYRYFVLQNPVGEVYTFDTETNSRIPVQGNHKPTAVISMTPNSNLTNVSKIAWDSNKSSDPDGDKIIKTEWDNKAESYAIGSYTVRLRVQDEHYTWSDWSQVSFNVVDNGPQPLETVVPTGFIAINTVDDLNKIGRATGYPSNGKYILMKNLDLNVAPYNTGAGWTPINQFQGVFDGNGLEIKNLYINNPSGSYLGLFGQLHSGTIQNLTLNSPKVTGSAFVGALVGDINYDHSTIYRCGILNPIISGGDKVGGLAGGADWSASNPNIYIKENYVKGANITGNDYLGGLVGYISGLGNSDYVQNNYVFGTLQWKYSMYKTDDHIGGLVGDSNSTYVETNNYTVVTVPPQTGGHSYRGCLYGWNQAYNCYFDSTVCNVTGYYGNTSLARTTAQMKQKATYVGWDFTNVWTIDEGNSYPKLKWEK